MRSMVSDRSIAEGQHQSLTDVGDEDRIVLVEWLNAAVGSKSYQRVLGLIAGIQSADSMFAAANRDSVYVRIGNNEWPEEKIRRQRKINKTLQTISAALADYVFRPRLTALLNANWRFDFCGDPLTKDFRFTRPSGRRVYEADAVFGVLRLASYGFLNRVKPCPICQKWFYARPSHKKFCSTACQLKHFSSSPSQKQKRAGYMRLYRVKDKQQATHEFQILHSLK